MKLRLALSPKAARRWRSICDGYAEINPPAGERLALAVGAALNRLLAFPLLGLPVHDFPGLNLRQLLVEPYRFYYVVDGRRGLIWVLDVWHVAQLAEAPELPAGL